MDPQALTPQQKLLGASGALVLYAISLLFFPWYEGFGQSVSGWDAVPSPWIWLILTLLGAAGLAAAAFDYELPISVDPVSLGVYCCSVVTIFTLAVVLDGGSRAWGIFVATLLAIVATALATWVWREHEA